MRLLTLKIQEPLPGLVFPEMIADHGPDEAARRYRAVVLTTLRQLRGLADARIRLISQPADADEAIRFWLLPRLAEKWLADDRIYRTDGWDIDFGGETESFGTLATGDVRCPFLGARWVHAALLGFGRTTRQVIGPAAGGGEYFRAELPDAGDETTPRHLPELPVIRTGDHWQQALDSTLGPALKRAWKEEGGDEIESPGSIFLT